MINDANIAHDLAWTVPPLDNYTGFYNIEIPVLQPRRNIDALHSIGKHDMVLTRSVLQAEITNLVKTG
ncbi:MAG: hypothetical protein CM1200mP10_19920 [Candidatus Neomarinimicrobiota bacterium]|nr:MAG: hypothetical protein CM1200mP10_19920 [Candidatus Neomarinimicrobiota bacterium]